MWKQWGQHKLPWRALDDTTTTTMSTSPDRRLNPHQRRRRASSARSSRSSSAVVYTGTCWLETLPQDIVETVLACLDHASSHAFELTSRFCADTMRTSAFWKNTIVDRLACFEDPSENHAALWKRMHCMKQRRAGFSSDALLTGVVACDSPNDYSVPPTWLLFKSRCWFWMEKLLSKTTERDTASLNVRQLHCGCGYHVPCFWSSSGSRSPDDVACIEFSVRPHSFLTQVQLVPYQAYWLEGHPGFAPKHVSFTFLHRDGETLHTFYESPVFSVRNEMTLHEFDLPQAVWTGSATVVRVQLIGRTQRAPLDERPWISKQLPPRTTSTSQGGADDHDHDNDDALAEYYCCLSYVNAVGFVVQDDATKKARRWWHH